MKRMLVLLIIAVLVVGGVAAARQAQPSEPVTQTQGVIDQATAAREDFRLTVSATGSVIPRRQVPLLFESSGVVRELLVTDGEAVTAGDALARLDTADLQSALTDAQLALNLQQISNEALTSPARPEDLAAAEAALNAALASLSAAYGSADPNQAEIARLRSEIARNQLWQAQLQNGIAASLRALGVPSGASGVSQSSLQQAEYGVQIADANAASAANRGADAGSVASANAAVVSAQQQLNRLQNGASDFDLQAAQINLNMAQLSVEQAQAALERATLFAPFDGVIAQNRLVEGEPPPGAEPAMLLIDNGELYVELAVDETDVVKLEEGQPVELTFDALPGANITGQVTRIAFTPTITGQLVTYAVRVTLDPSESLVRVGMSATATIVVDQLVNVLVVPNRFIRIDRTTGGAFVTVVDASTRAGYREIPVTLGLRNELSSQITAGLEAGQEVVLLPRAGFDVFGG